MPVPPPIVLVVPHTHWDREWYEPFQRFRFRLVDLLDEVLPRLREDPALRFTLDGQTAAVDDYLEVRPEAEPLVRELVRRGQLAVGPWRVLADSFLCAGETLVRNLELGLARAAELGGAMPVGYLPDQFGHAAQLPQLLRGFDLTQACLWRGVPSTVDTHTFSWVAPDGTAVRTEYLPGGYGNAATLFSDPRATSARAGEFAEHMRPWFGDTPPLAMYGADHGGPVASLSAQVAATPGLRLATLAEALADRGTPTAEVRGELRSHARANLLPGVLSARPSLKVAMARAERVVARYAEPLSALWDPAGGQPFLTMAWQRLVDASCHDSVTGCGADATAVQVAGRIAEAEHLGTAVRDRVLDRLAAEVPPDAVLVLNPSPHPRADVTTVTAVVPEDWSEVALELPDGHRVPAQELSRPPRELLAEEFPADRVVEAVRRRTFGQVMYDRAVRRAEVLDGEVLFLVGRRGDPAYDVAHLTAALARRVHEHGHWLVRVVDEPKRELLAAVPVPPLGWTTARPVRAATPVTNPVSTVDGTLANGLVAVTVEDEGTLRVTTADGTVLRGLGRLTDGGDAGDSYNYGPPVADLLVHEPVAMMVRQGATGPLVGSIDVLRTYDWPSGLADDEGSARSAGVTPTEVLTRVELRAGEPFVRLTVRFDNRAADHRVRLHLPVGEVPGSRAEGQFAVTARGLTGEGGNGETPLPTYPAAAFVTAGPLSVLLDTTTEYEVRGGELALTLLRAVGRISRNTHPLRAEPAGPTTPIPGAQEPGERVVRLAVVPGAHSDAELMRLSERFTLAPEVRGGTGSPDAPLTAEPGLAVRGATLTGLRDRDGELELRLVAYSEEPVTAVVQREGVKTARRTTLAGADLETLPVAASTVEIPLRPWEIATVRLG
ncbi:alpha-mannosidase [Crossiella equi]|uniref:Alpha-mannosidase n=1 Tax=Crossiella equi TaxID=130796 RepID=A0ABS5ABD5_9PSEU|nr:hypothetical protein [Crossiella equi]MBP2473646.1 alpha-mannosidase [Crossiella equi]